ncbi:MAG: diacylglycerol kinase family protein, partial [Bacteroidales bacterium]
MAHENKGFSIQARFKSFTYAFKGMSHVLKAEHNMWIHLSVTLAVIVLGAVLKISRFDWLIV